MTAPTIDDVAETLAQYEAAAIATGDWNGAEPPEFSADGTSWAPFWLDDTKTPELARATVRRRGVDAPTVVIVSWRESIPAEDSWRALWAAKPMKLFGAYALRAAIRRAFRDAVGDRRDPDEPRDPAAAWVPAEPRDWAAEVDAAATVDAVNALHIEAKRARAVTPQLEQALRARRQLLSSGATPPHVAPVGDAAPPAAPPAPDVQGEGPARPAPTPGTVPHAPRADAAPRTRKPRRAQSKGLTRSLADEVRDAVARHDAQGRKP